MQKMNKKTIIGFFVFLFLLVLFFNKILFNPENAVTINADLLRMTSVWESQITESLKNNNGLILWNNDVYSGTPFIGSPLTTMFYPLSIVFYLIPFHLAISYVIVMNLLLMGIFFYMYLRLIKVSKFSALLSVVIFIFSGMVVLWSGILSFINALVWFPLLIYFAERLILEKRVIFGFLMGLFMGIQILGSGPQIFLYSSFIVFLYLVLRLLYERKETTKIIGIFLIAAMVSVLICAVQLLPMLEYGKYSVREGGLDYETATMHSLPGYALATFFMPEFYGRGNLYWGFWKHSSFTEQYLYVGLVTLMLLLIAAFFVRKNKYVTIFSLIALFSLFFSFGKYTPFFSLFHKLPLFNAFRVPVRMMVFFVFSVAAISGFSLDRINDFNEANKNKLRRILFITVILVMLVAGGAAMAYYKQKEVVQFGKDFATKLYNSNIDASRITREGLDLNYFLRLVPSVFKSILNSIGIFLVLMVAILFVFYLWAWNKISFKYFKVLLLLVLVVELFIFSTKFIQPSSFEDKFNSNPIINTIKQDEGTFRVLSLRSSQTKDNLPQYLAVGNDIQLASGCDAIFLKRYAEYSCLYGDCEVKADACIPINDVKYPKMIDILNIKYVISSNDINDNSLSFLFNYDGGNLYRNNNALDRAFYVPRFKQADKEGVLNMLADKDFMTKRYAILEKNESKFEIAGTGDYKAVKITHNSPNNIVIEDEFDNNGFVVVSDANYNGWKAYVDGQETEIYDAYYILKSVYIEKGNHKIEFLYEPLSYKIGLYLSILSFMAVLLMIFLLR